MKTEWEFFFETRDFVFEKEHKYECKVSHPDFRRDGYTNGSEEISFAMRIVPDTEPKRKEVYQTGSLFITLPLRYEKAILIVRTLAYELEQRISFESGDFNIHYGALFCKCIPESPEEEQELGDKPYAASMTLREADVPEAFKSNCLCDDTKTILDTRLLSQYNFSRKANNSIDKLLGFFKIIESTFIPKKQSLADRLKGDDELFEIFKTKFNFASIEAARRSFDDFIDKIVHARHNCAHLKLKKNFGYVPLDPRIKEEVEPLIYPLQVLAHEIIVHFAKKKNNP